MDLNHKGEPKVNIHDVLMIHDRKIRRRAWSPGIYLYRLDDGTFNRIDEVTEDTWFRWPLIYFDLIADDWEVVPT
jgi:hypothetical protein